MTYCDVTHLVDERKLVLDVITVFTIHLYNYMLLLKQEAMSYTVGLDFLFV